METGYCTVKWNGMIRVHRHFLNEEEVTGGKSEYMH